MENTEETTKNTTSEWVRKSQERIKSHPAWHIHTSHSASEALLKNKSPFTFLLRPGEKEHSYFISFIKKDGSIKHQLFILELNRQGWYYRNGTTPNFPTEIIAEDLDEIISLIMYCHPKECISLTNKGHQC